MNSLFDVLSFAETIPAIPAPKPSLPGDLTPLPRPVQVGDTMVDATGQVYTCQTIVSRDWHGTGYTLCEFAISRNGRIVMDGGYAERFVYADSMEAKKITSLCQVSDGTASYKPDSVSGETEAGNASN